MKPISEQPLIRARNENRQYSENDGKTNFTPTHEDSGNSGINSPDNTGASKSPTDIPGTDDNNTSTDNKNGILKNVYELILHMYNVHCTYPMSH